MIASQHRCPSGGTLVWLISDPEKQHYPRVGCSLHFSEIPQDIVPEKKGLDMIAGRVAGFSMDEGAGCEDCQNSGYSGRMGIYEIMLMTPALRSLIKPGLSPVELKTAAGREGYRTMAADGIEKALAGLTTIEEVFRVTPPDMQAAPPVRRRPDKAPIVNAIKTSAVEAEVKSQAEPSSSQAVSAFTETAPADQKNQVLNVLVVDDSEIDRMVVCDALEDEGYVTTTAEDGLEALEAIKIQIPDLMVIDYMMPRMDGEKLIKELKAKPDTRSIPILMLTSVDSVQSEISILKAGADEYVTKPVNRERFLIRVENLLKRVPKALDERTSSEKAILV